MGELNYFHHLKFNTKLSRKPVIMIHFLLLIVTVFIQYLFVLSLQQFMLTVGLFAIYSTSYWYSDFILQKSETFYFSVQGIIILVCTYIMPNTAPIIVLGLMSILIIQGMFYFRQGSKFVILIVCYTIFYLVLMNIHFGPDYLWLFFTVYLVVFFGLILILYLFNQKDAENVELQYYIEELQVANKKIEQLTLQNERQRMARDLHDTLAQRLVGLILKLDASEAHLQKGNIEKVEAILASAKIQAKESLHDARKVIDDLRLAKSNETFEEQLQEEITQLHFIYKIPIEIIVEEIALSIAEESHILSIVKEAITNSYKHANANKIKIEICKINHHNVIKIQDDGKGISLATDLQRQGHYGILGMKERVQLMNGQLEIESVNGTCITIIIPVK